MKIKLFRDQEQLIHHRFTPFPLDFSGIEMGLKERGLKPSLLRFKPRLMTSHFLKTHYWPQPKHNFRQFWSSAQSCKSTDALFLLVICATSDFRPHLTQMGNHVALDALRCSPQSHLSPMRTLIRWVKLAVRTCLQMAKFTCIDLNTLD